MGNISGGDANTHLAADIGSKGVTFPAIKQDGDDITWEGDWATVVGEDGLPQLNAPPPVTADNKEAMELILNILKCPGQTSVEVPEGSIDAVKEVFSNYGDIVDGKLVLNEPPPPVMETTDEAADQ